MSQPCGVIGALCLALLCACDARPTGREDILAIARSKPGSPRSGAAGRGAEDVKDAEHAPDAAMLEPHLAAGSGSMEAVDPHAGQPMDKPAEPAEHGETDSASVPAEPMGTTGMPTVGGAQDIPRTPVLFWVDVVNNRVWRANADGTDKKLLASSLSISSPDGVTVDLNSGFVYWTNMGSLAGGANLGTIQRMRIDNERIETIVPVGLTNTPKQINIDNKARKLYWCDREGAKVWRSELDGSGAQVLVSGHGLMQPVGMALDVEKRQLYFSDRVTRKIYRAGFDAPEGQSPETRGDVEVLFSWSSGAPLDLDLDLEKRQIYWTDRFRHVIQRGNMDPPANFNPETRTDVETLAENRDEPVGLALDRADHQLYFTELSGGVFRMDRDGGTPVLVSTTGSASGITLAHMPK